MPLERNVPMKTMLTMLLTMLLFFSPCATAAEGGVEMLAVSVGKGDALLLRAGSYVCLIDTGKKSAKEAVEAALQYWQVEALDAVFLTHTDKDHSGGLKWLRKSDIEIRAVYASRYFSDMELEDHPAVKTAGKLGLSVGWLGAGDVVCMGDTDCRLRVLAPERKLEDEDDNSLVMMLESPHGKILLAGDMEHEEEELLLKSGQELRCDVLKVPNHADSDACGKGLIQACSAQIAVISTSTKEKSGTPDVTVLKNLKKAGSKVYITQECTLGVMLHLCDGTATAEYINRD